jgi:uncharacterized repeat protein (TIGR03803 family)
MGGVNDYGMIFAVNTDGSDFADLYDFGGDPDGASPEGALIVTNGVLYGTTSSGNNAVECGTIFSLNTDGSGFTTLHTFSPWGGSPGTMTNADGASPRAALALSGGTLYGTAADGGPQRCGTLFSISTNGDNFTLLHVFSTNSNDGECPNSDLLLDGDTLYGTTGAGTIGRDFFSTVFSVKTNGDSYTRLDTDPLQIMGLALAGNTLYGTTLGGSGISNGVLISLNYSNGTVFALDTNGSNFRHLHVFPPRSPNASGSNWDGAMPDAGLCLVSNMLYGTTEYGGAQKKGTVFTLRTDGSGFDVLHAFTSSKGDGANPQAGVIFAGNTLYGTTDSGTNGMKGAGTVFSLKLSPAVNDTNSPTLTVASPKKTLQTTNSQIIASGTAKDKVAVSAVMWSLNGGGWNEASTFNGWTNWTAALNLTVPGPEFHPKSIH